MLSLIGSASAEPVDYVKICDAFGVGFYYIPGTDTCLNVPDPPYSARRQTEYGTWAWTAPNNARTWVSSPAEGCPNGQLVKLGDITGSTLVYNDHDAPKIKVAGSDEARPLGMPVVSLFE